MTGPDNIVIWKGVTKHDLPPDRLLDSALGRLDNLVIMGWDKEGELYFASSMADGGNVLWLMRLCERKLLEIEP